MTEKDVTWLTEESANQYENPRFSPDGTMIVVGVGQPGGFKDIWVLDSKGVKIEELMHDRAIDGGAAWGRDGKIIFFSSDRTGIFNLYAYELRDKKDLPGDECPGRRLYPRGLTGRQDARVLVVQFHWIRYSPETGGLRFLETRRALHGPVSCRCLC